MADSERTAGPEAVPWIADLEPAVHGAVAGSTDVLDFSANGNVLGPPPGLWEALRAVDLARYPDPRSAELTLALASAHGVRPECVVVANGSTELIWAVARAFLAPGWRATVLGPTYGEYSVASRAAGGRADLVRAWGLNASASGATDGELFGFDEDGVADHLRRDPPRVVWLCHPNNPTGGAARIGQIEELTVHLPGALFVIDEAYIPFAPDLASAATLVQTGRVVVLRSMTKHAGLAGLRLGYAIASERVATVLRRALPPWSVNSLAQVAGMLALSDPAHDEAVRRAVRRSMSHLEGGLRSLGLCPLPTETNFVLVPVADGAALTGWLHERRIAVRDCASFGLAEYVRIGVRCIPDQERLLTAVGQWVRGHTPEGLTLAAVR